MFNSNTPLPILYEDNNIYTAFTNPSGLTVKNTAMAAFFRRYLLQRAMSRYKWTLPEGWSLRYFLYSLYMLGAVVVFRTDKFGVIPQHCTLSGYNVQYQPVYARVANPLLKSDTVVTLGKNGVLFTPTMDYMPIADLVNYYGDMMALAAEAAGVNVVNSRLAYIFFARSKTFAESYKEMFDRVISGEPGVVVDAKLKRDIDGKLDVEQFEHNLTQNFIAPRILEYMRDLENQFDAAVGINCSDSTKRERLVVDEVNANNEEIALRADMWLDNWQDSCRQVMDMFGVEIKVEKREVESYADKEQVVDSRPV